MIGHACVMDDSIVVNDGLADQYQDVTSSFTFNYCLQNVRYMHKIIVTV